MSPCMAGFVLIRLKPRPHKDWQTVTSPQLPWTLTRWWTCHELCTLVLSTDQAKLKLNGTNASWFRSQCEAIILLSPRVMTILQVRSLRLHKKQTRSIEYYINPCPIQVPFCLIRSWLSSSVRWWDSSPSLWVCFVLIAQWVGVVMANLALINRF